MNYTSGQTLFAIRFGQCLPYLMLSDDFNHRGAFHMKTLQCMMSCDVVMPNSFPPYFH